MMLTVPSPVCKHCEYMLQLGSCFGKNLTVLSLIFEQEVIVSPQRISSSGIKYFTGVKHPYCTELLQNCSCLQVPVNYQWQGRFSLSIWYERTFFLLFMGVGSSFDFKIKLSSFSSSLSGIVGVSKAQLVSSCYCVATLWPHC